MQLSLPELSIAKGIRQNSQHENVLVINAFGDITESSVQLIINTVYQAIDHRSLTNIILNLLMVGELTEPAAAMLTSLRDKVHLEGGDIRLLQPKNKVKHLLEQLELADFDNNQGVFLWFENLSQALESFE